ncbi:hypothetical protein Tco_0607574 [Tanacetum coccineum]
MPLQKSNAVGNGYCEYHRQKGHTTNECVQLRQLIDKLVKEGRLDHLVKNIKEGKDKQRSGGKKDAPRDKADTIYMITIPAKQWDYWKTRISAIRAVPPLRAHGIAKIPVDGGIVTIFTTLACTTPEKNATQSHRRAARLRDNTQQSDKP